MARVLGSRDKESCKGRPNQSCPLPGGCREREILKLLLFVTQRSKLRKGQGEQRPELYNASLVSPLATA